MKSKNSETVPAPLSGALSRNRKAMSVFRAMRPSCQDGYINRIKSGRKISLPERTKKVVEAILEYGKRHPEKLQKSL